MFMRFRGGGVGHKSTQRATEGLVVCKSPETQQHEDEAVELEDLGPSNTKVSDEMGDNDEDYGADEEGHDSDEDDEGHDSEDDGPGEDELNEDEEDELGPEDGEEDWEIDEGDLLGFAEP
jgi:hypothetical protein